MAIKIITDSASDILPEEAQTMGITVLPLTINWDDVVYQDAIDMNHQQFFTKLENSNSIPTTSQITPDVFEKAYQQLCQNQDIALVLTVSSKLSGTYQSAHIAAQDFEGKVWIVDSLNVSVGERILVEKAIEYVKQGLTIQSIVDKLLSDRQQVRVFARLETLEYLKKGGRISSMTALAGGLLSIKPVLTVSDGLVEMLGKARGVKNGNSLLAHFVAEEGMDEQQPYCLVYSGLSAENLHQFLNEHANDGILPQTRLPIHSIGAVIGTHVGPGAIGIAFFSKK